MRVVSINSKDAIEAAMGLATERLVRMNSSPLIMGGSIGLLCFIDGESPGFNFVSDWQYSPDFDQTGLDRDVMVALADYLENVAAMIRRREVDGLMQPREQPDVDGTA